MNITNTTWNNATGTAWGPSEAFSYLGGLPGKVAWWAVKASVHCGGVALADHHYDSYGRLPGYCVHTLATGAKWGARAVYCLSDGTRGVLNCASNGAWSREGVTSNSSTTWFTSARQGIAQAAQWTGRQCDGVNQAAMEALARLGLKVGSASPEELQDDPVTLTELVGAGGAVILATSAAVVLGRRALENLKSALSRDPCVELECRTVRGINVAGSVRMTRRMTHGQAWKGFALNGVSSFALGVISALTCWGLGRRVGLIQSPWVCQAAWTAYEAAGLWGQIPELVKMMPTTE